MSGRTTLLGQDSDTAWGRGAVVVDKAMVRLEQTLRREVNDKGRQAAVAVVMAVAGFIAMAVFMTTAVTAVAVALPLNMAVKVMMTVG